MPGTVITVHIKAGDEVGKGEPLLIVEAMKMEYTLLAPRASPTTRVQAKVGDRVMVDASLVHLDPVMSTS
jgi:3-methylcrotonyl-CoA carboxylase alpha subunit